MSTYAASVIPGCAPSPRDIVRRALFERCQKVLLQASIPTFGLDRFLVTDRHGGDADTAQHVRRIGVDPEMPCKRGDHAGTREARGGCDPKRVRNARRLRCCGLSAGTNRTPPATRRLRRTLTRPALFSGGFPDVPAGAGCPAPAF